jgi:hypothetical protein
MLTESSEAMSFRETGLSQKRLQILAIASLSSPHFDANPFLGRGEMSPVFGRFLSLRAPRRDGAGTAIMETCPLFESCLFDDLH